MEIHTTIFNKYICNFNRYFQYNKNKYNSIFII